MNVILLTHQQYVILYVLSNDQILNHESNRLP